MNVLWVLAHDDSLLYRVFYRSRRKATEVAKALESSGLRVLVVLPGEKEDGIVQKEGNG